MSNFDHILNWKLLRGSHDFPGPDGGTCINEAAVVACGFSYQPVGSVKRMPKCFSRPVCELAMQLNDGASDEERQRLMPFVTRLACADMPKIERERACYINVRIGRHRPFPGDFQFEEGLRVLEGALTIGRQADPIGMGEAASRLDAVRRRAEPVKRRSGSLPAKVKGWLSLPQALESAG
ncbi:hypothetical protein ACRAWG_39455 (plasmid) [Methylobacterium sp. P31]